MVITFEVVSGCYGVVDRLLSQKGAYVCEREVLCVVKTSGGKLVEVSATFSGYLRSFHVNPGDRVSPDTVLACMQEDALALCASSD
jgi:pyruvate/2-oxoglutarate dehydrogenase complex dihydrolipoamide acyltransferase (E2) component